MFPILTDRGLYEYTGGKPPSLGQLRARYARQAAGHSPDGAQGWLNWIIRHRETGDVAGTVQATLSTADGHMSAEIAWVIGTAHQHRGYAKEAATEMAQWLRTRGSHVLIAHIHPQHEASISVARYLGLTPTDVVVGGETRWVSSE
jgi:RimJ/RimL family protein N-acetyltransferase